MTQIAWPHWNLNSNSQKGSPSKMSQTTFKWRNRLKVFLLYCSITVILSKPALGQIVLNSERVEQRPNTVGAQSADLTIQFVTPVDIPYGSKILITVPNQARLEQAATIPCQIRGIYDFSGFCATSGVRGIVFQLPLGRLNVPYLPKGSTNSLILSGSFYAPLSTKPTDPFKIQILNPAGQVLVVDNNKFVLFGLDPAEIQATSVSHVDSMTVGAPTAVYFTVTSRNPIPAQGGVQLILPKWNTRAASSVQESYLMSILDNLGTVLTPQASPTSSNTDLPIDKTRLCSPKNGVSSQVKCSIFSTADYDYITVTNLFDGGTVREAGLTFQFYVAHLRNPISMSPVPFEVVTFSAVQEITPKGEYRFEGKIDRGTADFVAGDSVAIDPKACSVNAEDPTVQEATTYTIAFNVPVPVEEGCIVTIQLPEDFKVSAGDTNRVQGWGIFGFRTDLNVGIDESRRIIRIVDQCESYSAANTRTEIQIVFIKNPPVVKQTKSFIIEVQDKNARGIARIGTEVFFTPRNGKVSDISLVSLGEKSIGALVEMMVSFTPKHAISGPSFMLITFPDQMVFNCNVGSTTGLKTALTCKETGLKNQLRFDNPFVKDIYLGNSPLSITFRNRILPGANLMIKGISIATFMAIENVDYLIDKLEDRNLEFFAPDQLLFLASTVSAGSIEVYTATYVTLQHTLASNVPFGAIVYVSIPPQIEIYDIAAVERSCKVDANLESPLSCTCVEQINGSHQLTVRNAFPREGLAKQMEFKLTILEGMLTPLSMKTSDSFKVNITDADNHQINYALTAISLTMKQGKDVGPIQVEVSSGVVGAYSEHKVSFNTPTPLYEGYLIIVNIPVEFEPPLNQNLRCQTEFPLSQDGFGCKSNNGQKITVRVEKDISYPGIRIAIGEKISFKFALIRNPSSTLPTSPYSIQIMTNNFQIVAVQRTQGKILANTVPAVITKFDFQALDPRQMATTTFTISWTNTQPYPKGLTLLIEYDASEIRPNIPNDKSIVPCIFRRTVFVDCQYTQPGIIKVSNLLLTEMAPNLQLSLTLTNQLINIQKPKTTKSWKLTTYTDTSTQYSIDTISGGMSLKFECNLPCLKCSPDNPDFCTECNQYQDDFLILYKGKCSANCPTGTFKKGYECIPCDDKCKTCAEKSGSTCTSCYGGYSNFPFLFGNTCVSECVSGSYGNRLNATCNMCEDPCQTCSEQPNNCTSCKMPPPNEPLVHFYHENKCKARCPDGWIADGPSRSNVCEKCDDNCATCFGTRSQCRTCNPGFKLNTLDLTCVQQCPRDITVTLNDPDRGQICEPCDSSCVTCSGTPTFCTSCQKKMSLQKSPAASICKLECDIATFKQVSLKGTCVGCSASCATCQHTQDYCLSCIPGRYLYANQCLEKCPSKDGYQYQPTSERICTIPGIICPFGYELTPTGDGCVLKAQICISPNTLNYDKTGCVPGSDAWIPFPMLGFCVLVTLVVAVGKCKHLESSFIANMIVFLSLVEFMGVFVVLYFAQRFGISPVVYLILVAIMFTIAINLFFLVVFQKQVMNDLTFRHWATYNKCTVRTITAIGFIFSFKVYRLLYSKFFGAKSFDAPFDDSYKFFTPLNIASFMNLLLVKIVCMAACIFGIIYIDWGYQVLIECIEFLIIEVIMLCLYIAEYFQMRSTLLKQKAAWKVDAKQVDKLKVMSGYEEDLSDDGQDPDQYMKNDGKYLSQARKVVKPKALKTIHTMEKVLASLLVQRRKMELGYESTAHEIELLHERELMLRGRRRCMSFRQDRPDFRQAWGFESDEENDANQNFISEPGSPRSKEMLHNPYFTTRMHALNKVYQMRDQFDNCYSEAKDRFVWPLTNAPQQNKKVQTNVMELLGVDDLEEDSQTQVTEEDDVSDNHDDYDNQATNLIKGVIEQIDSEMDRSVQDYTTNEALMVRRGSHPNAENYNSGKVSTRPPISKLSKSNKAKKKRKRLTRRRMAELPNFDVEEILGEFEIDPEGNYLILQTADGKLNDKYGRSVNRRGYLTDPIGNVVTRGNVFIFYKEEIDFDDEIPAPYCFQKAKNVKFTVKNFSVHRRMRRKDKLAMQDEFIEREYRRLKESAKPRGDIHSQQYSRQGIQGLNQSEQVHYGRDSAKGNKQLSSHLQYMESSGAALLVNESALQLGDVNLSNINLAQGRNFSDDEDCLNAEQFIAQNSTKVNRKTPNLKRSRQKSKNDQDSKIDPEDDDFINEVTEPLKAKTKSELLGRSALKGSRQSSRSRSKSNEESQRSSQKRKSRRKKKGDEMLNEASFEKSGIMSDQHLSLAEMMALPTAEVEAIESSGNDYQNLEFDKKKLLNNSSSLQMKKKSKQSAIFGQSQQRPGSGVKPFYENERRIYQQGKKKVVNDEEFIKKVQQFNSYLDKKKTSFQQAEIERMRGLSGAANAIIIDDTFLNPDGSVRQVGLAHKNLNSVYGRVRSKFNKQIRQGGTALKALPHSHLYPLNNRVDEPRRILAGMSHAQRERMLQLEINNLIEGSNDDMSLASIQRKLNEEIRWHDSQAEVTSQSRIEENRRRNNNRDSKLQELRGIYSDYRLDGANQKMQVTSPKSHANLMFNAQNILKEDLQEAAYPIAGRRIDAEIRKVSQRVSVVQALNDVRSSSKTSQEGNQKHQQKTNRTSGVIRSIPNDLLHGKYL